MNLPHIRFNKNYLIGLGLILLIAILYIFVFPLMQPKPVTAQLQQEVLYPNGQTVLLVTVNNFEENTLNSVTVSAYTVDPNIVIIGPNPESSVIGSGEYRVFKFDVVVLSSATSASHVIKIRVPALNEEINTKLEIQ